MVIDNVVINKSIALERCVKRIKAVHGDSQIELFENLTKQESIILNLQRACELSIDLAAHLAKVKQLGVAQTNRDLFDLLISANLLSVSVGTTMKRMVGFRNIAIHEYQKLDINIMKSILENQLADFEAFVNEVKRA